MSTNTIKPESQNPTPNPGEVKTPSRSRGHARVALLLEAASVEFASKGYDATTMTAIAARAKSSIGSLYQFFPTKENMAIALMEQYIAKLRDEFEALRKDAPALTLPFIAKRLIVMFVMFRKSHPAFAALVEANDGALPVSRDIRLMLRTDISSVLAILAPHLTEIDRELRAAVIQHLMKAAVSLNGDATVREPDRATAELEHLLEHYLKASLSKD